MRATRASALALALCVLLTVWAYRDVPRLGFSDIDGATLLRASELTPTRSLAAVLLDEFRANPEAGRGFYRPLTSLSYSLQQRLTPRQLWPLHCFDLLLHIALAFAVHALARALAMSRFSALLAASYVALHPLAAEVVPFLARRGESLAMLLLTLSLWAQLRGRRRLALAFAVLAPLAKESGFLVAALALFLDHDKSWRRRVGRALLCIAPALLLRLWVIGGIGGYGELQVMVPAFGRAFLDLLDPQRLTGLWGARAVGLVALGAMAFSWRDRAVRLGLLWLFLALNLTSFSMGLAAWYLYAALPAQALWLAALLRDGWSSWRCRLGLALMALSFAVSPAWITYPEWKASSAWNERFLAALHTRCELDEISADSAIALAGIPVAQGQGPMARWRLHSTHVALGWSLRDALFWRFGQRLEIYGVAPVRVHAIDAEYRMHVEGDGPEIRIWPSGPVRLSPPDLATERFGQRVLPFSAEAVADTMTVRALTVPLWYWDGADVVRFGAGD